MRKRPHDRKGSHRPQGKTTDMEHMAAKKAPLQPPAQPKPRDEAHPSRTPADEAIGGSRPRVESKVKEAIGRREAGE
jgi:hypothetical protein